MPTLWIQRAQWKPRRCVKSEVLNLARKMCASMTFICNRQASSLPLPLRNPFVDPRIIILCGESWKTAPDQPQGTPSEVLLLMAPIRRQRSWTEPHDYIIDFLHDDPKVVGEGATKFQGGLESGKAQNFLTWRLLIIILIDSEFRKLIELATAQIIALGRSEVDIRTAGEKDVSKLSEEGTYQIFWVTPRWHTCSKGSRANRPRHSSDHEIPGAW